MKRTIALMTAIVLASSANAEPMESYLEKQKTIEQKEQTRQELELDLSIANLRHELQNVGKEDSNQQENQQGGIRYNNQGFVPGGQQDDEPTMEELREQRKNTILDGLSLSSVYKENDTGKLIAEMVPSQPGGQTMSVTKGDVVGNWKITQVSLKAVRAEHIKEDETRIIQYGARY